MPIDEGYIPAEDMQVDNITIETNGDGQIQVKDGGINNAKITDVSVTKVTSNYNIGDDILIADDDEEHSSSTSWVKMKEFTISKLNPSPTPLRISFFCRREDNDAAVNAQIYKNGEPVGTLRSSITISGVTFTEDLEFAEGDKVQLYARCTSTATDLWVKNFRIKGSSEELNKGFEASETG